MGSEENHRFPITALGNDKMGMEENNSGAGIKRLPRADKSAIAMTKKSEKKDRSDKMLTI
ncbi:MAG: hypothetical protein AB1349_11375 [Elusimicrobiota bacterium]